MNKKKLLTDEEVVSRVQSSVKIAIAKQEAMGIAVVRYDPEKSCFYVKGQDGTRKILKQGVKRVRYSERATARKKEKA